VAFTSSPVGAEVWVGPRGRERRLGVTPTTADFDTAETGVRVRFTLPGHVDVVRTVALVAGAAADVRLRPRSAAAPTTKKSGELLNPF
jgi:hypothetical protein